MNFPKNCFIIKRKQTSAVASGKQGGQQTNELKMDQQQDRRMPKRFREYEHDPAIKMCARSLHTQLLRECQQQEVLVNGIKNWPYALTSHAQDDVQFAVYNSQWAREWQIFRIALKGLSTRQKLYHLRDRWRIIMQQDGSTSRAQEVRCKTIQIENYIGALRRGGQLDELNFIAREY